MRKDEAAPLQGVVKDIIQGLVEKGRPKEEEMLKVWRSAVGRKAASHTRPASLRRSRLVVNVNGSGWLYELTLKKRDILKKLEGRFKGKKIIKDIRFRIGEIKDEEKTKAL